MARILIKNGSVFDGERFLDADVLTDGGFITELALDVRSEADLVYDAAGMTVLPGLVDVHMHVKGISCEKYGTHGEASAFPFGVTAAADAEGTFGDQALLDSFLLKSVVFVRAPIREDRFDPSGIGAALMRYGDRAVGLKVYFDTRVSEVTDTEPLREVCAYARKKGLRVMVHCSNSPVPMAEILAVLGKGDILTHAFHGGENTADADGFSAMREAQARGVLIDVGMAGHVHTDFHVLRTAIENGIVPDLLGTDITRSSAFRRGERYGMTMCMNIARALRLPEEEIFRAVTSRAAEALGRGTEWGRLAVGRAADVAVLKETNESFDLTDKRGNRVKGAEGYRCVLTLSSGDIVYRD